MTRTPNESTQKHYGGFIREFRKWSSEHGVEHLADVSTPHLHLYADFLTKRGNHANTRASKQNLVTRLFGYMVETGVISRSPVPPGWAPKNEPPPPIPTLSSEDVEALFDASRQHASALDVGLLVTLAGWDGVKLAHIVALSAEDVRIDESGVTIPIRRKDDTIHHRRLSQKSAEHLTALIQERPTGRLFYPGVSDLNAARSRAKRALTSIGEKAGVHGAITARRLERSYRARVVDGGIPMEAVLESLGLLGGGAAHHRRTTLPQHGPETAGDRARDRAIGEFKALEVLSQAQTLSEQDGVTPIAPIVVAGAALEMVLRAMCDDQAVAIQAKQPGIAAYADALRRLSLISKHAHAQILANGKLRNDAAHGVNSGAVTMANARVMIRSIALFLGGQEDAT